MYLLIGRAKLDLKIEDSKSGNFLFSTVISIFSLLLNSSEIALPSSLEILSKNFDIGDPTNLFIKHLASQKDTNPILQSELKKFEVKGKINSKIEINLDSSDLSKTKGFAKIDLKGLMLQINPSFNIPDQLFTKALVAFKIDNSKLELDQNSQLLSNNLSVNMNGAVDLAQKLQQSKINFDIKIALREEMKESFSLMLEMATKKETDGKLNLSINGPISNPQIKIN